MDEVDKMEDTAVDVAKTVDEAAARHCTTQYELWRQRSGGQHGKNPFWFFSN